MRNKLLKTTFFMFLMALAIIVTFFLTKMYYTALNDRPPAKGPGTDIIDLKIDELKKDVTPSHSETNERWIKYNIEDSGTSYFDSVSIVRTSEKRVKVWTKYVVEGLIIPHSDSGIEESLLQNREFKAVIRLEEYDCELRMIKIHNHYYISNKGERLEHKNWTPEWKSIIPESSNEVLFNKLCKEDIK